MNLPKKFLFLIFYTSIALCQINITGKVIDTLGNPIRGAQVTLAVAGLKTVTDSTGQFVLDSTSLENLSNQYKLQILGSPFIKNHVLFFSVLQPGTQVMADVRFATLTAKLEEKRQQRQ